MDKKISQLRKLKAKYIREKKQQEARSLNSQFKQDTRQVCAKFAAICESGDCPTYQRANTNGSHDSSNTFENIEEASSFWQCLWETRGTGDKDADWLQEMKQAIARQVHVPSPAEQD